MAKKVRLTEKQVLMLQKLENKKVIKLTETQFKRIFESEGGLGDIPISLKPSNRITKNFKKAVKTIPDAEIKVEGDLLGHPVAGSGGDEYNPQTDAEHKKTFNSFNENEMMGGVSYEDFAANVLECLKKLLTNPTDESISPFWQQMSVGKDEIISAMSDLGMIEAYTQHGLPKYKVYKEGFKEKVRELYKMLSGTEESVPQEEGIVQFGDDIELDEMDRDDIKQKMSEPFKPKHGPKQSPEEIKKKLAAIRAKELERRKGEGTVEEGDWFDNLSYHPANQKDPTLGRQPKERPFKLVEWHQDIAIFEKDGKYYAFAVESVDHDDYSEYADRDEEFMGYDEDGMPDVEYGDWEMDGYIVDAYVNDNFNGLDYGRGLSDWEDGKQMVEIDQALKDDLLSLTKYIRVPREAEQWQKAISNIQVQDVEESTTASSSGAFVGKLGGGSLNMGRSPEEELGEASKKKKRAKAQQMQNEPEVEPETKKSGLQTVQVTQQDIQNAMGRHNVYKDRKKHSTKYAGRKDKHKGKKFDEVSTSPDLVNTDSDKMLSEYDWTSVIEFEVPEYGSYRVENVRNPQEKEHSKTYFIELSKDNRPVSSHLIYYLPENGREQLSFVWKYEKIIPNILDKVDLIFKGELEKLMDKIKGNGVEETTVAGASADGGSSGPYVTPKMWAKSKKDWVMNKSDKTAWKKGTIVQKEMQPNITMESKNMTDTAYPEGEFVELDSCVRPGNNDKNIEGGCSQGAVDGVVKTKKTGKSVISKEALYYEVAKKTGKTIEEVKNILEKSGQNE